MTGTEKGGHDNDPFQHTVAMDAFRIDSHKLIFHPRRVYQWLHGEPIYPVYMEVSPSGACNHRCTFCALDYLGYRPQFLNKDIFIKRLAELGRLGIKSIMYAGEGEPLMHRDIIEIVNHTKGSGIDVAITTNGTRLSGELFKNIADSVTWIKVSIDAGNPETYAALHRTKSDDFERVMSNLSDVTDIIRSTGSQCTVGAQFILLPENMNELEILAGRVKDIGLKYLVIKPYSQHNKSMTRMYENLDYSNILSVVEGLESFNGNDFRVIFRDNAFRKAYSRQRAYEQCLALPFWSYIDSGGNVWGCSSYLGDDRFLYGNVHESSFQDIWTGEPRIKSLEMAACTLDPSDCRVNCRMDEANRFLWMISHLPEHVNFI